MFYCNQCRIEKRWPESLSISRGTCEICGERADCYDVPSKYLPKAPPSLEPTSSSFWVAYDPANITPGCRIVVTRGNGDTYDFVLDGKDINDHCIVVRGEHNTDILGQFNCKSTVFRRHNGVRDVEATDRISHIQINASTAPWMCVAVFVRHRNRYLIGTRYVKTTALGVHEQCVPGGKVDWMETLEEAARREVYEETGLRVENLRQLGISDSMRAGWDRIGWHFCTVFYEGDVVDINEFKVTEPEKQGDWKWLTADEIRLKYSSLFNQAHTFLDKLTAPYTLQEFTSGGYTEFRAVKDGGVVGRYSFRGVARDDLAKTVEELEERVAREQRHISMLKQHIRGAAVSTPEALRYD